jgi:hypothetical protein
MNSNSGGVGQAEPGHHHQGHGDAPGPGQRPAQMDRRYTRSVLPTNLKTKILRDQPKNSAGDAEISAPT